jgi:hypothetical protein
MKIAVASDVHLEFGPVVFENTMGAVVLVLSGDVCVAHDLLEHDSPPMQGSAKSERIHNFFYDVCNKFPHVVYVVGNHEHYHYDFKYTVSHLKKMLKYLPNLQVLEKETWTLFDEVTFVGGTLWTDMNKGDTFTMHHIKDGMSDFQVVKNSNRMVNRKVPLYQENLLYTEDGKNGSMYIKDEKGNLVPNGFKFKEEVSKFSPEDAMEDHKKMLDFIRHVTEGQHDKKFVVCTHHTPSPMSIHPKYANSELMNGGYTSDLTQFILDRPQIKLWTHGHTHEDFDYMIGSTRVVCNPRGYDGYEQRADYFQLKCFEV